MTAWGISFPLTRNPVEVIKAAQAATAACQDSPTWTTSPAYRILDAVTQAATLRLDGYAEAPWWWTRPQRRSGIPVGVALAEDHPEVSGLVWVTPDAVSQYWDTAAVVITTVAAVTTFPADLKARAGVFVLLTCTPRADFTDAPGHLSLSSRFGRPPRGTNERLNLAAEDSISAGR